MKRLVLELFPSADENEEPKIVFRVTDPPLFGIPARPLTVTATEAEFEALKQASLHGGAVRLAGQKLFEALALNREVGDQLTAALQARPDEHCPVYLQITASAGVEDLPWETLCSPGGDFLALDERWGLGRAVESITATPPAYTFSPPLRIAAILSCLNVEAGEELAALREAIATVPQLGTELLLFTSEEKVYEAITAESPPGIQVEIVPTELRELQEKVQGFQPHVLHFFCHGTTVAEPHLLVATKKNWITGRMEESLAIGAKEFRRFTRETDPPPWLLVLNACESAANAAQENLQSLASRLLYYGAAPAVVGMREPVLSGDANLLTSAFYRRLLSDLRNRLAGKDFAGNPVDWVVGLVVEVRHQLALKDPALTLDMAAASTKEWTLPVAYVSVRPFTLQVMAAASARIRLEMEGLRQLHDALPPDPAADPLRADAMARIGQMEKQLEES
ncbi:MAG TPA: CHAT domain-containing protein [Candidatus Limnocylindrales bacterium]|nr:CHAT domain-containing protein [Candidatus Limnocylindrales bacterium]